MSQKLPVLSVKQTNNEDLELQIIGNGQELLIMLASAMDRSPTLLDLFKATVAFYEMAKNKEANNKTQLN